MIAYLALIVGAIAVFTTETAAENIQPLKFCSQGFGRPAMMEFDETYDHLTITIGDKTEKYELFEAEGPHESQALAYASDDNTIIGVTTAKAALGEYPLLPIYIYEDRVFWPCQAAK